MKTHKSNPAHKIAGIILIVTALVSVAWINPALSINSRIDKVAPEKESQDAVAPAPATKDSVKIKKKVYSYNHINYRFIARAYKYSCKQ